MLNTAIQLSLQKFRGKLFVLFVDFCSVQRAFPSISHAKLYDKLFQVGVSGKMIRNIRAIYEVAATRVITEHGSTKSIEITEGFLQGEILSPIAFSLYISEIEKILEGSGASPAKITDILQMHLLLFADDTAVVAATAEDLQRKITTLEKYFKELELKVNLEKTEVVMFRKGGRVSKSVRFTYDGKEIGIVNEYVYLGVAFASSGLYCKAVKHFRSKGLVAVGSTWKVVGGGRMNAWNEKIALFNSVVSSVVLYSAHIWALNYCDGVEQIQTMFLKRILGVSKYTELYSSFGSRHA